MNHFTVLLKPASSLCNLHCKYCFYADVASFREIRSFGIMQDDTKKAILDNIFSGLNGESSVHIAFQGGEPTLAGIDWFRQFAELVDEKKGNVRVSYAIQTNAVLLDDEWCEFLGRNKFLVGVSLDGTESVHNQNRVDSNGKGTYRTVMKAVKALKRHGVEFNILMTLTSNLARYPNQVWDVIKENDFRFVQFTPCLPGLDDVGKAPYALVPMRFASFYTQLFKLWFAEYERGNYFSIKLFDDLVNMIAFGKINACGLNGICSPQLVVEADGSAYPCDFYMLDEWKIGSLKSQSIEEILASHKYSEFRNRSRIRVLCQECQYKQICNGACQRMQSQICYSETDQFCGYRAFLDSAMDKLSMLSVQQRRLRCNSK